MSQRRKKKLESLKVRNNKYTQRANEQKRKELSKTTTTNKRGRQVDKKKQLSNLPQEGQRALLLKMGGHGMGADYKKSEKEAFKKAEKWQKSDEKKKITENKKNKGNKLKINKNKKTGGGGSKTPAGYVRDKGRMYSARSAQGRKLANELKRKKRAKEMAKNRQSTFVQNNPPPSQGGFFYGNTKEAFSYEDVK